VTLRTVTALLEMLLAKVVVSVLTSPGGSPVDLDGLELLDARRTGSEPSEQQKKVK